MLSRQATANGVVGSPPLPALKPATAGSTSDRGRARLRGQLLAGKPVPAMVQCRGTATPSRARVSTRCQFVIFYE